MLSMLLQFLNVENIVVLNVSMLKKNIKREIPILFPTAAVKFQKFSSVKLFTSESHC